MNSSPPLHLSRFIGRHQEIAAIKEQLSQTRLLTLTGPGGCGKTRLAAVVTDQVQDDYEGGVIWVDLAAITDETLVAQVLAKAAKVKEQPGLSITEMLVDSFSGLQMLIVLDNCEHLVVACVRLVSRLMASCPGLHFLTTSREFLALEGESIFLVPPLSLPRTAPIAEISPGDDGTHEMLDSLAQYEAVELFLVRAASKKPGFTLTAQNAAAIASICIRLDGMPLAIELAAARVNVLTAEQIDQRLDDRFSLLKSDMRRVSDLRHHTLHAAIDWSNDLLSKPERLLLQRLSVFAGGCSLATAEAVCAGDGIERETILDHISSLVNKSLVVSETVWRSEARYTLLETIRQYGQEKLKIVGERHVFRDRHLHWFSDLAQETDPKIRGEYQQLWLNWLENENANMRAALSWSLESAQIEAGLLIAVALFQFWTIRDYVQEGLTWFQRLLKRSGDGVPALLRSNALANASTLAGRRGLIDFTQKYADEAANLGEVAGKDGWSALARARASQAWVAHKKGDFEKGLSLGMDSIQLWRKLDDHYMLGLSLSLFSFLAMSLSKFDQAQNMLDEALPLLRQSGDKYRLAMGLNYYGDLARCRGDHSQAILYYEESFPLLRDIDAVRDQASVYHNLGHSLLHLGNVDQARDLFEKSLNIHQEQGNELGTIECLIGFAALAIMGNRPAIGTRLLASVASLGGSSVTSEWAATRMEYEYYLARARSNLSNSVFQAELKAGKAMYLEQGMTVAKDFLRESDAAKKYRHQYEQLTPREREVAILIAQGKSNDQIAAELVVSKRTAEKHIAHIRSKLGFTERTQIVLWGIEAGLVKARDHSADS